MSTNVESALPKKTKMEAYTDWFVKWIPESFFFCLALTLLIAALAFFICDTPVWSQEGVNLVSAWTGGFWSLLTFTMQMTVLLVTGTAVAGSPPAKKLLSALARIPKTQAQIIIMASVLSSLLGYLHWGVGMMGGIMLGKELLASAKVRGIKVHNPILVTAIFLSFMVGCEGISGAAPLFAASPGYLKTMVPAEYVDLVPETLTIASTVGSPMFILTLILGVIICTIACLVIAPKDPTKIEEVDDEVIAETLKGAGTEKIDRSTPAARMNNSRIIMYILGGTGLAWSIMNLMQSGLVGLSLNNYNFLMLTLGMVLCGNPELFCKCIRDGLSGCWGFVIQFPFYAGIFGLITQSGLGMVFANAFIAISNAETFPVITYIYSALLTFAVPSGGSKFVIEAPYIIPAALETGANLPAVICAYQLGDGLVSVIVPFFALPYLANFKLKFSQLIPYTVIAGGFVFVLNIIMLYFVI